MFTKRQSQHTETTTGKTALGAVRAGGMQRGGHYARAGLSGGLKTQSQLHGVVVVAAASLILASSGFVYGQDLYIQSITTNPANPAIGDYFNITVTVANQGSYAAGFFKLNVHSELATEPNDMCQNREEECPYTYGLGAGQSLPCTFYNYFYATGGEHTIYAWVDACNDVTEYGFLPEANNLTSQSIQVGPIVPPAPPAMPDLIVQSITPLTTPTLGVPFMMRVTVLNQGPGATGRETRLLIDRDRTSSPGIECLGQLDLPVPDLARNSTHDEVVEVTYTSGGAHTFWARVDGCGNVSESDESNNRSFRTSQIAAPDLIVESISAPPSFLFLNTNLTLTARIKNIGSVRSAACTAHIFKNRSTAPFTLCSSDISPVFVRALDPNGDFTDVPVTVNYDTTGDKRLWVWADGCRIVGEMDDNNNTRNIIIRSRRGPNLVIDSITPTESPVRQLNSTSVDVVVRNAGDVATPTGSVITVHGFLNSTSAPTCGSFDRVRTSTGSLAAGATRTLRLTNITYAWFGEHTFHAKVDPCDDIRESSGSDNSRARVIDVHLPL